MKLSNFIKKISKKLKFVNTGSKFNASVEAVDFNVDNLEVNFYEMDINRINIIKTIFDNSEEIDYNEKIYKILPLICDIEIDISLDEFTNLMNFPNEYFVEFMKIVLSTMDEIRQLVLEYNNLEDSLKDELEKEVVDAIDNIDNREVNIEKEKKDKINDLYNLLSITENPVVRKSILDELIKLEN